MDIPKGHPSGVDVRAFLKEVEPRIHDKLEEEILALNGIKFQLAVKVQLRKDNPDGSEEYTDPVLRHKQEALLQASEINEDLNKAVPHLLELLDKWTQRGSGWVVDRVQTLWLDIARYQPLRGGQTEPPVEYRGPDAAEHLLQSLQEEESKIKGVLADPKDMRITREDWLAFRKAEHATYVTILSRATLCVITATLRVNIEGQPIIPATSSYGYTPASPWCFTTCGAMNPTC